ncbi:bifunctional peptidase and arginyl-hydroxylase JMJD5 [Chironomus tepperi]|uniref:bifunctional peptidase and arginyl-hydroxylase JMJD5 n=1 Tax=Chironomus tepperi TaxID=113505 RepID=UPI00391EEB26
MEELLDYVQKLNFKSELLKSCNINLLTIDDIKVIKDFKDDWKLQIKISIEYDILYDKLYIGPYYQVPDDYKRMFLVLSFFKSLGILKSDKKEVQEYVEAIKILDVAIMIGSGLDECELITDFAQKVHNYIVENNKIELVSQIPDEQLQTSYTDCDIDSISQPSIEHFMTKYFNFHQPVKILNCISHWPALDKWKDMNYFMNLAGYRTVPIELGRTYDDDEWGQNLYKFGDFIKQYMNNDDHEQKAYLAQHDLFDQIPELSKDFTTPDYCAIGNQDPVIIKSWIGPKNTISTMHTDDKHNFLCQVVGEKLIILASPKESENLYPYEGLLNNTTQVDVENLDFAKFPNVKNVKFQRIVLKAGQMLYIPKLHWHYVRSLTPSISISFWFNCDED